MYCYTKDEVTQIKGKVLFIGDSITQHHMYVSFINTYLKLYGSGDIEIISAGLSGETVAGLTEKSHQNPRPVVFSRIDALLQEVKPDFVISCYGINDGIYESYCDDNFYHFKCGIKALIEKIHEYNAKAIILTPPPYLIDFCDKEHPNQSPDYDKAMQKYSNWIVNKVKDMADCVIDIRTPMIQSINQRKALDGNFVVNDPVHPDLLGHFAMANKVLTKAFNRVTINFLQVMQRDNFTLFNLILNRDKLNHAKLMKKTCTKLHVCLTELSESEVETEIARLNVEIDEYISSHNELFAWDETFFGKHKEHHFFFQGYEAVVVEPENPLPNRPWIWRTEFFKGFPTVDIALAEAGYHVVHIKISNQYGCPRAVKIMEDFYHQIVGKYNLNEKGVFEGFSRGGLYAVHYASAYPEHVEALYLDAPVVDIKSWPKGEGLGDSSSMSEEWHECRLAFGLDSDDDDKFAKILENAVDTIANANIPVIIVAGGSDNVVPYDENGITIQRKYESENKPFKLILKEGVGHHPHSLEDPSEVVEFLL